MTANSPSRQQDQQIYIIDDEKKMKNLYTHKFAQIYSAGAQAVLANNLTVKKGIDPVGYLDDNASDDDRR